MDAVQRTNDDATQSKRSAVELGYWDDPYLKSMIPWNPGGGGRSTRKSPEIHLGYFTRVAGMWRLMEELVSLVYSQSSMTSGHSGSTSLQVLNLGAGFDTLYWRLRDHIRSHCVEEKLVGQVASQGDTKLLSTQTKFKFQQIDIDLPEVAANKCTLVRRNSTLMEGIKESQPSKSSDPDSGSQSVPKTTDFHSDDYHIVGCDFTRLADLETKMTDCGVDFTTPTLLVAECVLVYLQPDKVSSFLQWIKEKFTGGVAIVNHEQLNMNDRFGQVMLDNLSQRGCGLPGAFPACKNKESQVSRLTAPPVGWDNAICWSMNEVYQSLLHSDEVARVERLEFLDEKELVHQLFDHYCVTLGWANGTKVNFDEMKNINGGEEISVPHFRQLI